MKTAQRWYVVEAKEDGANCLVEANAPSQALRRTAEHYCTARVASTADVMAMMKRGCDVIHAPQEPEQMDIEVLQPQESLPT